MRFKFFKAIRITVAVMLFIAVGVSGVYCSYLYIAPNQRLMPKVTDVAAGGRVNLLFLATDEGGLLTDTVMLFSFNPDENRLNLLSIPRDTRISRNGSYMKFNALYALGEEGKRHEEPIRYVKELTGLPIHYYAVVHPEGVRNIVDILGGVWIDVPMRMYYRDPDQNLTIDLAPGYQLLDGKKAEQFTRFRAGYVNADLGRIDAQQVFLKELIYQKAKPEYLSKAPELLNQVSKHVQTNISASDLPLFLSMFKEIEQCSFFAYRMPLSEEWVNGISYVVCDVGKTRELISREFLDEGEQIP